MCWETSLDRCIFISDSEIPLEGVCVGFDYETVGVVYSLVKEAPSGFFHIVGLGGLMNFRR